jgi:hypothetical protein
MAMQRWEYLTITIAGYQWSDSLGRQGSVPSYKGIAMPNVTQLLNELGEQGWELAGAIEMTLYLKRPRR